MRPARLSLSVLAAVWIAASFAVPSAAALPKAKPKPRPAHKAPVKKAPSKVVPPKSPPVPAGPVLKSLVVHPDKVVLAGGRARQLLLVTGTYSDGEVRDLSTQARYVSKQPSIAQVGAEGAVTPLGAGSSEIVVSVGSTSVRVPVQVAAAGPPAVSFTRDIVPLLTQAGCNSLNCHGSPVGKAGFKLSMYGSDPADDYAAIATQERKVEEKGKRVDAVPEKSLVLTKPSMEVPHQGGMRFRSGSPQHQMLLSWLRAGAPNDAAETPSVAALEMTPGDRVLSKVGQKQRLLVTARYTDGTTEDVTHKAVFTSNDDSVAESGDGELESKGIGETAILARYLGRVGTAQFYVPQPDPVLESEYRRFRPVNYIDGLSLAKWRKMRFVPSDPCTDTEFLRRVKLDLTGTLPTADEVRAFMADPAPDKRTRRIDELLASEDYADWWSVFWGDILRNNSRLVQAKGAVTYRAWLRQSVAENKPYDQFARELVTATGGNFTVGPASFYRVANTTMDRAEQVAQIFLGVRLNCAQCHNHPFERWTRTNYHQFAAVFARVQTRNLGGNETSVSTQAKGDYKHPETNQVLAPAVLGDASLEFPEAQDRREILAEWLVARENAMFSRNLVNRLWGQLFGRGIVEPVDDIRVTNPAVNEPLLAALAKDFVEGGYDMRRMLRQIATSATYQLSVTPTKQNVQDRQNFSRAYFRRLKAEALIDGVCQATNQPERYNGHPAGTRAIQLTDNRVASYFLDVFGRPRREVVCTCEREETANISQALHLMNGPINQKINARDGRLATLLAASRSDREIVEELYFWTVSRPPTEAEVEAALKEVETAGPKNRNQALEDRFWVLLNSREFLFNH